MVTGIVGSASRVRKCTCAGKVGVGFIWDWGLSGGVIEEGGKIVLGGFKRGGS